MSKGGPIDLTARDRNMHHRERDDRGRVVIPARLGWWAQLQRERMCRRMHGHCFHNHLMTFWNCCMRGMTEDGMPRQKCHYCPELEAKVAYVY